MPIHRRRVLALVVVAACSSKSPSSPREDDVCKETQALTVAPIFGTSLAAKQIALTFDDGPGTRTSELSTYLKNEGIRAAFFVTGASFANANVDASQLLQQLVADGHVVANHTQTHPSLPSLQPAEIVSELQQTDAIIAPFVPANRFMFRAPFGAWDMNVYTALQASPMSKYVGHIEWDVGGQRTATTGADFACWQGIDGPPITAKACGDLYLQEIATVGKGIVLMHDADYGPPANQDPDTGTGNTVIMVKYMVPLLKAQGYTFVRVDEVPDIAAQLPPLPPPPADAGADATPPPPPPPKSVTPPPPLPCP